MGSSVRERLDAVPRKMLKSAGDPDLKNLQNDAREAHGRVLARAIKLANLSQKEATQALGSVEPRRDISEPQLHAWLSGKENPHTWRFQQHPLLGLALLLAEAEARGVLKEYVLRIPAFTTTEAA